MNIIQAGNITLTEQKNNWNELYSVDNAYVLMPANNYWIVCTVFTLKKGVVYNWMNTSCWEKNHLKILLQDKPVFRKPEYSVMAHGLNYSLYICYSII